MEFFVNFILNLSEDELLVPNFFFGKQTVLEVVVLESGSGRLDFSF